MFLDVPVFLDDILWAAPVSRFPGYAPQAQKDLPHFRVGFMAFLPFPLIEDVEILRLHPRSFPNLPFFRHSKGHGGAKPGSGFGPKFLWNWWKRACDNLGIEGVNFTAAQGTAR
jgi:hypothetical protein